MNPISEIIALLAPWWALLVHTWWLWAPFALFIAAKNTWKIYLKVRYFSDLKWKTLEVRLPRDLPKTPEAMEQVFAGLQTMYFSFDPLEKWWEGLQHDYIIFEIMSFGGETHFYIRTPEFFKNPVEAQIYAQYPEVEISEVEDWTGRVPPEVPSPDWDLFGIEFKLTKPDPYPIATWRDIQSSGEKEPERVDPFTTIAELFGKIHGGEYMGYHLLMRPAQVDEGNKWREQGEGLVAKLIGKKVAPKKNRIQKALEPLAPLYEGLASDLGTVISGPSEEGAPKKKDEGRVGESLMQHLSPGMKTVVEAVERNISKPGWEVIVRYCYVARRDVFHLSHLSSFIGSMKQYNTLNLNSFALDGASMATAAPWWFPKKMKSERKAWKKKIFYKYFLARKPFTDVPYLKSKFMTLNTEELATIYHYPGRVTKAPMVERIEARRSEPPSGLPTG